MLKTIFLLLLFFVFFVSFVVIFILQTFLFHHEEHEERENYKHIGINPYNFFTDEICHKTLSQTVYVNAKFYNILYPYAYWIKDFPKNYIWSG